jgi:zinc D-Ala-D-Ala carboxypeptidase
MGKRLTTNFTLDELTRTRFSVDNTPGKKEEAALQLLAEKVLQPARDALGPIEVTSGFRSVSVNTLVHGARNSHHLKGMAADLQMPDGNHKRLFDYIRTHLVYTQLIWEFGSIDQPQWVHVSYDPADLKMQVLRAITYGKRVKYLEL